MNLSTQLAIDLSAERGRWAIRRALRQRIAARLREQRNLQQGGAAVAHQIHTLEVAGSNPAPATFRKTDSPERSQCAAVGGELVDAKGLARDGHKPLMRNREGHESPSPIASTAAHDLSEVSGPAEPGARLATKNERSRNNASDALAADEQGLNHPSRHPLAQAPMGQPIDSPTLNRTAVDTTKRSSAAFSNPNGAPEVYNQVHVYPKGRWS